MASNDKVEDLAGQLGVRHRLAALSIARLDQRVQGIRTPPTLTPPLFGDLQDEMDTEKKRITARRIGVSVPKLLMRVGFRVFPPSRNLWRYYGTFGQLPNLLVPRRLTEKLQRKILFDRNPRLPIFADKLRARGFVRATLGDGRCLSKLYAVVESPEEIRRLTLPTKFVMKPNHASGMIKVVGDPSDVSPGELEGLASKWLKVNYYDVTKEWAYKKIKPRIMFEELLEVDGKVAGDFKFHCFHGEPRFLLVTKDRFTNLKINIYDMNLSLLPVRLKDHENFPGELIAPPNFDEMKHIARQLSAGMDYLRVDLYNLPGRIVFGELTNYTGNARTQYEPPAWDYKFGSYW